MQRPSRKAQIADLAPESAWPPRFVKESPPPRQAARDLHSRNVKERAMASEAAQQTTTAEAVVASLAAHGIDAVYALPGIQNDHLFDALFRAGNRIRTVHTRHEQGSAYMALGAALATGRPQAFAVVNGPGLLNASAALLTAYSMNAPVLGLIGEIPARDIGRNIGHLHELRGQADVIARLVGHSAQIGAPADAPRRVAEAMRAMQTGRRGPAALVCPIDVWGARGPVTPQLPLAPLAPDQPAIDEDAILAAAKRLGAAKNPMI